MSRTILITAAVAGLLLLSTTNLVADETVKAPTITDAKLGSMRYGGESILYWVEKMKPGDQTTANRLKTDLGKLRSRMQRIKDADAAQLKLLNEYFTAIEKSILAKAGSAKKVAASKSAVTKPRPIAELSPQSKGLPPANGNPADFVNSIQAKYQNGGTVQLPKIRRMLNDNKLSEQEVDQVLADFARYETEVAKDLPTLKKVVETSGQGDYWLRWIGGEAQKAYQQEIRVLQSSIDNKITRAAQDAKNRAELDIEKHNFQFRGTAALNTLKRLDNAIAMIEQAARLEKPFALDGRWSSQKAALVKNTAAYRAKVEQVDSGKSTVLPKEVVNNDLRKVAEAVLRKEKYGIEKWERLIVNSKLMPRERIEHKAFSGRIETIVRQWQEYQVTTVEKDKNGKLYLYHNMIAKFSRGPNTTPIGEWILSKRFKGNAIAKENLK